MFRSRSLLLALIRSLILGLCLGSAGIVAADASADPAAADAPVVMVFGDSLAAAYGIPRDRGWVALLQTRLTERGFPQRIVNASVSGATSADGLTRLPALLQRYQPVLVLLELGANDGLRGLPPGRMGANLKRMIELNRQAGAQTLLFEMRMPPNYGPRYAQAFRDRFHDVAEQTRTPLVPFFLATLADDPDAFQSDGLHPTAAVQPRLLDAIWPELAPLLKN